MVWWCGFLPHISESYSTIPDRCIHLDRWSPWSSQRIHVVVSWQQRRLVWIVGDSDGYCPQWTRALKSDILPRFSKTWVIAVTLHWSMALHGWFAMGAHVLSKILGWYQSSATALLFQIPSQQLCCRPCVSTHMDLLRMRWTRVPESCTFQQ